VSRESKDKWKHDVTKEIIPELNEKCLLSNRHDSQENRNDKVITQETHDNQLKKDKGRHDMVIFNCFE